MINIIKEKIFFIILICAFFVISDSYSSTNYFVEGKKFFDEKIYEKSKFFFQQDIVFNPKNSKSYLYLAKIFEFEKNIEAQEKNLNTTLLLDPSNEDAIYMLIQLKLSQSDFINANILKNKFYLVCSKLCYKKDEIEKILEDNSLQISDSNQ
jgi:hypothetical protein